MAGKQPLKKKEVKSFDLASFKQKIGIKNAGSNLSNADKPMQWLIMPPAFSDALAAIWLV